MSVRRMNWLKGLTAFHKGTAVAPSRRPSADVYGVENTAWTHQETVSSEDTRGARPPGSSVVADEKFASDDHCRKETGR